MTALKETPDFDIKRLKTIDSIAKGKNDNPVIEYLLLQLAGRLKNIQGKKVYGYLKENNKLLVNQIYAELAKDERIARLYDLWYEQREKILRTYTSDLPERVPLVDNKEFDSVRNMIVSESLTISESDDFVFREPDVQESVIQAQTEQKSEVEREKSIDYDDGDLFSYPESDNTDGDGSRNDNSGADSSDKTDDDSDSSDRHVEPFPSVPDVSNYPNVAANALGLLDSLARLIQNKMYGGSADGEEKLHRLDRKLRRRIEEKEEAMGIKHSE